MGLDRTRSKGWEIHSCDQKGGTVKVTSPPALIPPHSPPSGNIYIQFLLWQQQSQELQAAQGLGGGSRETAPDVGSLGVLSGRPPWTKCDGGEWATRDLRLYLG